MKPLEAAQNLEIVLSLTKDGQPLPPSLRTWLCGALAGRLQDHTKSIDQRLGLRNRSGGRLHATSHLPALHLAILGLAGDSGTIAERSRKLAARIAKHRRIPDPTLTEIEKEHGRIPGTARQLARILSGQTEALRQGKLKQRDVSLPWLAAPYTHEPH